MLMATALSASTTRVSLPKTIGAVFCHLCNEQVEDLGLNFACECKLLSGVVAEAEHNLFQQDEPGQSKWACSLSVADLCVIAQVKHPDLDFAKAAVSINEIKTVLSTIQLHVDASEEQSLGHFTCRKLKLLAVAGRHNDMMVNTSSWITSMP